MTNKFKEKSCDSFILSVHMAGDFASAKSIIQRYAADFGMCVSLTKQSYVYTGGCEDGVVVGFINYPRFPKEPEVIVSEAKDLAFHMAIELGQSSYSIVTPEKTFWFSRRD